MPKVKLLDVTKRYGKITAVNRLSLIIEDGEMIKLLGPSGCGKTTTLRCIAGFVVPDSGHIFIGDQDVTNIPPEKRDISFVFQNFALWPHMTVYHNLAFGLRLRKLQRHEIKERAHDALALLRMTGLEAASLVNCQVDSNNVSLWLELLCYALVSYCWMSPFPTSMRN